MQASFNISTMSLLDGAAILSRGEVCSSRPATERLASRLRAGLVLLLKKWKLWSREDHILSCDVLLCKLSNYTKPHEYFVTSLIPKLDLGMGASATVPVCGTYYDDHYQ